MPQKWTNADLSKVSRYGGPDLSTFEPEQLNLDGFEPLENVDLRNHQTPYTGPKDRKPAATEDYLPKPEPKMGWSDQLMSAGRAVKDLAVGMVKQGTDLVQATQGNPVPITLSGLQQYESIADKAKKASESKGIEKAARYAALPLDVAGAPVTDAAEGIVRGDYGNAAVMGGLALLGAKGMAHDLGSLRKAPTVSPVSVGERGASAFNKKIPLEGSYFDKGTGGELPFTDNIDLHPTSPAHEQPGLDFSPQAKSLVPQQTLDFSEPKGEYHQPGLDLTMGNPNVRMPNEFLPDGSFMPDESNVGAPKHLFEKDKVPFNRAPDDVLDEIIKSKPDYSNPRLERVPLESLRATQDHLYPDAVQDYINQGDRPDLTEVPSKARGRMDDEAPVVIRVGDQNILAGGHHRATADLARGKNDIQAVVYDAPNISNDLLKKLQDSVKRDRDSAAIKRGEKAPPKEDLGTAKFAFDWPEVGKMYNVEGGPHHGSTLSAESLKEYGIPFDEDIFPKEMRAKNKPENVAMGGADERVLDVLGSSLYSRRPAVVATKELLQNAIDEHKISGSKEPIRAIFNHHDVDPITGEKGIPSIHIGDSGRGLTKEQIYTVLTDVGKTGKLNEANASGGFGFAKASPMLGGKFARFESVVDEGGQRVRHTFEGTPEQLKNQNEGVPIKTEVVDKSTPTGFRAKVYYGADDSLYSATDLGNKIAQKSMGLSNPFEYSERFGPIDPEDANKYFTGNWASKYDKPNRINPTGELKKQATLNLPGADVDIHFDDVDSKTKNQRYNIDILNHGMYQFETADTYSRMGALRGVPENIKANIRATVKEGETNYPYTANREQAAAHITLGIKNWIEENLIKGAREKQKQALRDMYDQMHEVIPHDPNLDYRPVVLFDPDNLLAPHELKYLQSNSFIQDFGKTTEQIINRALEHFTDEDWNNKIEKVGISLDPEHHGIWIPNPDRGGKATILLNPFNFIEKFNNDPPAAALEMMSTAWHEVGHTDEVPNKPLDWSKVDSNAEGIGNFFKKYIDEVQHANAVSDTGHGLAWLRATGEVYARSGINQWNHGVEAILNAFTDYGNYSGYSQDVQKALRIYSERAGRAGADENILSRTGVSEKSKPGETESVFGNAKPNGGRPNNPKGDALTEQFNKPIKWSPKTAPNPAESIQTTVKEIQKKPPKEVDALLQNSASELRKISEDPNISRDEKEGLISKVLNFQRTVLTSADLSAPGRQGLPLIGRKEWWTSWKPMFEALGSDKGYNQVMESIKQDPSGLFSPALKGKSFANEAGLSLTDILDHREELFRSKWAEEFAGTKWFVKPSVRAYTAYLNKLRADTFKNMVKAAGAENNLPDAKKIADFINVATGRGSLGAFDPASKALAQVFFSPRLAASRLQMYTRTFNPMYYASVPKEVRVNQLKSMLALAGTGLAIGQLAKGMGATVEVDDPYNSDFGKIRFGNTRIDPFAGHQQYLVAAARLLMGKTTSSVSGKTHSLTTGKFGMPTRASVFGNFMKNKLAPVPSFIWSWMEGKAFDGQPFDAKNEAMQRVVPIVTQDLYDIWKDNPELLPGLFASGSAMIGGGVQTYGR